jgi:hypothetical protein
VRFFVGAAATDIHVPGFVEQGSMIRADVDEGDAGVGNERDIMNFKQMRIVSND